MNLNLYNDDNKKKSQWKAGLKMQCIHHSPAKCVDMKIEIIKKSK